MTEPYDRTILNRLQKAVTAAVAASSTATLPVAYLGLTFEVPDDQKYLEIRFIPNNSGGDFWGEEKNYQGLLNLILHWPIDNEGVYPPMDALASIVSYFNKGRVLTEVLIEEAPDVKAALEKGSEMLYPCTIRYKCFRS